MLILSFYIVIKIHIYQEIKCGHDLEEKSNINLNVKVETSYP